MNRFDQVSRITAKLDGRGVVAWLLGADSDLTYAAWLDARTVAFPGDPDRTHDTVLSLKAGGTGLNLTAADTVVLLDPWWNPAVEAQAADRAHRIGQTRSVTIVRLVAQDTVEIGILQMQSEKRELADALLDGTGASATLTSDDLLRLMRDA
jgi:hypothetical protein